MKGLVGEHTLGDGHALLAVLPLASGVSRGRGSTDMSGLTEHTGEACSWEQAASCSCGEGRGMLQSTSAWSFRGCLHTRKELSREQVGHGAPAH